MPATRPGTDRIRKQELQAAAIAAERGIHAHLLACLTCKHAPNDVRKRCGTWWELSKQAHRARRRLRQWQAPETEGMAPMFTEEACDPPPF